MMVEVLKQAGTCLQRVVEDVWEYQSLIGTVIQGGCLAGVLSLEVPVDISLLDGESSLWQGKTGSPGWADVVRAMPL